MSLSTNTYFPSLINLPYHQPIAMATRDLPSIYSSSSLSTDPHTTRFGASPRRVRPAKAYSDYGFIAVLALIQRLEIDLLPITWQAKLGQGGQAEINQALVNLQTSFAFKQFKRVDQSDPFWEIVQEMVVLRHPVVRNHPHIIQLIGICWDIPRNDQVWPVLVFKNPSSVIFIALHDLPRAEI